MAKITVLTVLLALAGCTQEKTGGILLKEASGRPLSIKTQNGLVAIGRVATASDVDSQFGDFAIIATESGMKLAGITQRDGDKMVEFFSEGKRVEVIVTQAYGGDHGRLIELIPNGNPRISVRSPLVKRQESVIILMIKGPAPDEGVK